MTEKQHATRRIQVMADLKVYNPFEGNAIELMQRLLTGKDETGAKVDFTRLPITSKQFAQVQLGCLKDARGLDTDDLRNVLAITTSTAILTNPKGNDIKFDNDHPLIYGLTVNTKLMEGKLPITQRQYNASKGFHLIESDVNEFIHNQFALPEVRRALFEYLFEGDVQLTKDYIVYAEKTHEPLKFEDSILGICLSAESGLSISKGLCLLDMYTARSDARHCISESNLDNVDCHHCNLVGAITEPELVSKKTGIPLEQLL